MDFHMTCYVTLSLAPEGAPEDGLRQAIKDFQAALEKVGAGYVLDLRNVRSGVNVAHAVHPGPVKRASKAAS
jgi:hypothetical protein